MINLDGLMFYGDFEKQFTCLYDDNTYAKVIKASMLYQRLILDKGYTTISFKMDFMKRQLKNEFTSFYGLLVILDTIFPTESFKEIISDNKIMLNFFIKELDKALLFNKLKGQQMDIEETYTGSIMRIFERYYGHSNYKLYILKLYEIKVLKTILYRQVEDLRNNKKL